MKKTLLITASVAAFSLFLTAADWAEWGGNHSKNMVSTEKDLPVEMVPGKKLSGTEQVDMSTTKNCLWAQKLGSQTYGTPTIGSGKILVGTNNEAPRDAKYEGDRSAVYCFDEKTGKFLWELNLPKLGAGKVSDWEFLGICSSATIVGDKAYVIGNRCEVICIDMEGMANGNQGVTDEATDLAGKNREGGNNPPVAITATDADILWRYDMRGELGVFPHNIASSSPVVVDGVVMVTTSNGVDWSHTNIPAPQAPSLIMLDAETGELIGEGAHVVSERCLHCSWSSPGFGKVGDKNMVFFGGGDGWAYGFSTETEKDEEGFDIMKEFWRYDCNPPEYRKDKEGNPIKYPDYAGPSEVIGTPVYHEGLLYLSIGQDPEHGEGVGMFSCIDPSQSGDITGKAVWTFKELERTMSTPSIQDGLVYIADHTGRVFCLDAKTGEKFWMYDTKGHIWGSTLVADGKVYIANEEGQIFILAAGKEMKLLNTVEFPAPIYASPVAANGVLYVPTTTHLYAFKKDGTPLESK